jgi:hypothetical protein
VTRSDWITGVFVESDSWPVSMRTNSHETWHISEFSTIGCGEELVRLDDNVEIDVQGIK